VIKVVHLHPRLVAAGDDMEFVRCVLYREEGCGGGHAYARNEFLIAVGEPEHAQFFTRLGPATVCACKSSNPHKSKFAERIADGFVEARRKGRVGFRNFSLIP